MASSSSPPLARARRRLCFDLQRVHAAWAWWTAVNSDDPLRHALNQGFIYIVTTWLLLCFAGIISLATSLIVTMTMASLLLALLLCWWLARRGSAGGAILLTVVSAISSAIGVLPSAYAGRDPTVHLVFMVPIAIATLFIRPRAGIWAALLQIGTLIVAALHAHLPQENIQTFAVAAVLDLGTVTVILMAGAAIFASALRASARASVALKTLNMELEQRVAARTADLAAANARIERRAAARADEVAKVVHDLRHEVTLVGIAADTLVMDAEDAGLPLGQIMPAQAQTAEALNQLAVLLDEMLDAARLEGSALRLQSQRTDMAALAAAAIERIQPQFQKANCQLVFEPPGPLPDAWCDGRRIRRVVLNVLLNALTYTSDYHQKGAPGIAQPAPPQVRVTLACEGEEIVCRVADNGPGIAPDALVRLGQRFARVASGSEAPEGAGLGLNFCLGVLALSGGSLALESEGLGHGTTAVVRLPCAPAVPHPKLNGDNRPHAMSAKGV